MAVDSLWMYRRNKGVLGAQQPIGTGPVVVDKSNINDITQYISQGLR
jgi:simple sugar transport system substrate-binding protein